MSETTLTLNVRAANVTASVCSVFPSVCERKDSWGTVSHCAPSNLEPEEEAIKGQVKLV